MNIGTMKIAAIITARAGSKRIPGKNTKLLGGRPLIGYTLRALQLQRYDFEAFAISTNDPMAMAIALSQSQYFYRGIVPIVRPEELSQGEENSHIRTIRHAVSQFPEGSFDAVMTLHPTSPFRRSKHIEEAAELFEKTGKNLVSVNPEGVRNAAIYITPVSEILENDRLKIYNQDSVQYEMDYENSLDINTLNDWEYAEHLLREKPELS